MTKLVVEVHYASDLMPKDGQGSASPFVEVDFDDQRQRTQTKPTDLNPCWDEKLVFNVNHPRALLHKSIDVVVYNDGNGTHQTNFLGRVRIYGDSVPTSESEATIHRYPLDKRGLFSDIKGDIALRIYIVYDASSSYAPRPEAGRVDEKDTPLQEINAKNLVEQMEENRVEEKKKKRGKEVRTSHSVGSAQSIPSPQYSMSSGSGFGSEKEKPAGMEARTDFAQVQAGSATVMRYLYVSVVMARDLPVMDITGTFDTYVEVKLGSYKGVTKRLKNQNQVWKQVFAFSEEKLQSGILEVTVKDKDTIIKDDFVGRVVFDPWEVPFREPPGSTLAPQWYKLADKKGKKTEGEVMLAVWMGTQADEAFPEAWCPDARSVSHSNLSNTRSKVYFSPRLCYLRVKVIEAQDLITSEKGRSPEAFVRVRLGNQARMTKPWQMRGNPVWMEEFMFVASEPFEDFLIVQVVDRVAPGRDEILGELRTPVRDVPPRMLETTKLPDGHWFALQKPSQSGEEGTESKLHLLLSLEDGYHVFEESPSVISDLQPSARNLRKDKIGILDLGILSAKNLLPMKEKDDRTTDAYCVARYGDKWIRTRTLLDTLHPRWNEQYTWKVYDPFTVITIGVFDNSHVNGKEDGGRDQTIGKVRIRLSTLETDRVYSLFNPLLVLTPSGLKKHGELHLALRFTCTAWVNMVAQYGRPLLPKMHYVNPIPVRQIDWLRHSAIQIVAERLSRAEPPLRPETVHYMLDVDYHRWSLRKSKANFFRIMDLLSGFKAVCKWLDDVRLWRNPITSCGVHVFFFFLVCYAKLILPFIFLSLFARGVWNYRFRPRQPPLMDARVSKADVATQEELAEEFDNIATPEKLDEEFDTFPTTKPTDIVKWRYDRLRSVAGKVQTVIGDLATHGERFHALLNWRDPRATTIVIIFLLILAIFICVTSFQVVAVLVGLYLLRHPRFRRKLPSVPINFFKRLPCKSDMLL